VPEASGYFIEVATEIHVSKHHGEDILVIETQVVVLGRQDQDCCYENAAIAEGLRAKDPQILDQLILQYQHRLMRYLVHLTGNREVAEDLFQETWMRVLRRGSQFRGQSKFVTWLFTIARNLVFDMHRRGSPTQSFDEMTESGDERRLHRAAREETPFDHCAARENEEIISAAVGELTPAQREVFMLRYREQLPLQEIAKVTRQPISTVKARLYRGIAVMKSQIAPKRCD
jgi:RNA polymerase sigma-70 factor (ECF subfamily)